MAEGYVVVTGASKGIGHATALLLDKMGFHVFAGVRKAADGAPPELVAEAVAHALTVDRPQTCYLVGGDAKFVARFILRLPTRLRDRLMLAQG